MEAISEANFDNSEPMDAKLNAYLDVYRQQKRRIESLELELLLEKQENAARKAEIERLTS